MKEGFDFKQVSDRGELISPPGTMVRLAKPTVVALRSRPSLMSRLTRRLPPKDWLWDLGWQLVRFGIAGGTSAVVGLSILYALTDLAGLWYVAGSTVAFIGASITAFTLQKFWTFREKTLSRIPMQGALGLTLSLVNFVLNAVLIYLLVDRVGLHHLLAQCVIFGFFGTVDFLIYKLVIFKHAV